MEKVSQMDLPDMTVNI